MNEPIIDMPEGFQWDLPREQDATMYCPAGHRDHVEWPYERAELWARSKRFVENHAGCVRPEMRESGR